MVLKHTRRGPKLFGNIQNVLDYFYDPHTAWSLDKPWNDSEHQENVSKK
jgi:hypothetical protein